MAVSFGVKRKRSGAIFSLGVIPEIIGDEEEEAERLMEGFSGSGMGAGNEDTSPRD